MKSYYFIFILVICSFQCFASKVVPDTIDREKYLLSKKEFLEAYGRDDSSTALINYYFEHRNLKKGHTYFYLGVCIVEAPLLWNVIRYKGQHPIEDTGLGFGFVAYTAIVFIPITTYTLIKLNKAQKAFPKRQLYLDLLDYQAGRGLPEKHRKPMLETPAYWKAP